MSHTLFHSIWELSERRIAFFQEGNHNGWYRGSETYIEWIHDELREVQEEWKDHNHVFLEDELWDVFWNYICLLHSLEHEGKIKKNRIFERIYKKFSERVGEDGRGGTDWEGVKKRQKEELRREHDLHEKRKKTDRLILPDT